jgi:hypothetical protein
MISPRRIFAWLMFRSIQMYLKPDVHAVATVAGILLLALLGFAYCLQVEKTAGQQKLQLVEDLVQLHAQLQVLLQDHATSPESKLFPADAVGVLLQCNHLTN